MKLFSVPLSNFASKSRIVVYEKDVDVDIVEPPGGLYSEEYRNVNPIGKVPAIKVDGQLIPESEVINEYLEDKFPDPTLLPGSPEDRARIRTLARFHDLYLEPPVRELFNHLDPDERDEAVVEEKLNEVQDRLDQLEDLLSGEQYAAGSRFTLADAALAPTFFFIETLLPMFGVEDPIGDRSTVSRWWETVQERPSVQRALEEMQGGWEAMMDG